MKGIIYKYTSPSGKSYIGQTVNPERRHNEHKRMKGRESAFHRAIKKYGFDNFKYEVLVTIDLEDKQELKQKLDYFEQFYIRKYHTFENGYNLTLGGGGSLSCFHTEESKRKMSKSQKGNKNCLGRVLSDETKRKIGEANRGRKMSDEVCRKMSEAHRNMSEETKRKMSESHKGIKRGAPSDEARRKMSESHKGHVPWNKGLKGVQSAWNKGVKMSEETKQKISEYGKNHPRLRDEKGHFIKSA